MADFPTILFPVPGPGGPTETGKVLTAVGDGTATWGSPGEVQAPSCRVYSSVPFTVPDAVNTIIPFDSARWDTDNMYSAVNPSRITFNTAGLYLVGGCMEFPGAPTSAGSKTMFVRASGAIPFISAGDQAPGTDYYFELETNTIWPFQVGEYIELQVYQSSGVPLDLPAVEAYSPAEMYATRLGPIPGP